MRQKPWQRVLLYAVVVFWCFVCLFPFYWLFTTSFKTPLAVSRGPRYLPFVDYQPTGEHWEYLLDEQRDSLLRHFRNSLIAATGSTILALVIGAMGGYGLARYRYRWRSRRAGRRLCRVVHQNGLDNHVAAHSRRNYPLAAPGLKLNGVFLPQRCV